LLVGVVVHRHFDKKELGQIRATLPYLKIK